jgi:hypothetical protein
MCTTRFVMVWLESSLCPAKRCRGSSCPRMQSLAPGWRGSVNQLSWWCQLPTLSGWWTYSSETYEFVSWDDDIPNIYIYIWKVIKFMFQTTNQLWKVKLWRVPIPRRKVVKGRFGPIKVPGALLSLLWLAPREVPWVQLGCHQQCLDKDRGGTTNLRMLLRHIQTNFILAWQNSRSEWYCGLKIWSIRFRRKDLLISSVQRSGDTALNKLGIEPCLVCIDYCLCTHLDSYPLNFLCLNMQVSSFFTAKNPPSKSYFRSKWLAQSRHRSVARRIHCSRRHGTMGGWWVAGGYLPLQDHNTLARDGLSSSMCLFVSLFCLVLL